MLKIGLLATKKFLGSHLLNRIKRVPHPEVGKKAQFLEQVAGEFLLLVIRYY